MGDAAEDAYNSWLYQAYFSDPDPLGRFEWQDSDGRILDMHNMSSIHLGNCLKFCELHGLSDKAAEIMTILKDRVGVS